MKDTNQRLFLAVALCLAATFLWSILFKPKTLPAGPSAAIAGAASPSAAQAVPSPVSVSALGAGAGADVPRGTSTPRPPAQRVALESDKLHLVLTSEGAALESVELKGQKFLRHKVGSKEGSPVNLIQASPGEPLTLSTLVLGADPSAPPLIRADAPYEVVRSEPLSVTFRTESAGVTVTKTISVDPDHYRLNLAVDVRSAGALTGHLAVLGASHSEAPTGGGFFSRSASVPARTICKAGDKLERVAVGAKSPSWDGPGAAAFAGIDEQYFLMAVLPPAGSASTCHLEAQPQGAMVSTLTLPLSLLAGGTTALSFNIFAGPKDTEELAAVAPILKDAVDLGFWAVIANLLLGVMKFFHKVIPGHNWGIAIILLTVSMKALTFPLQHKSMKSMQEMQRIQPQLEELKKKYPNDTQRQNQEQMKLFKEHGVNPMGSCLPMLIQMPIWFALYTTLQVSVELYNAAFIPGWLNDLTAKDPYYVLPVAMGITMILTQVLTPTPMSNPSQKTMGYAMSGFFSLLMLNLPSGLTLYIFVNNVLSIMQQMYLRRAMRPPAPPASGQTVAVSAARV